MSRFLEAANQAERAAEACGTEAELAETMKVLAYMEEIQTAMINQALARQAASDSRCKELLPLMDEGHEFARVQARIPKALAFGLMKQKNFGEDGLYSDEGMKDLLKQYPQFRVKTISGKTVFGYRGRRTAGRGNGVSGKRGVKFGPGVLNLAT